MASKEISVAGYESDNFFSDCEEAAVSSETVKDSRTAANHFAERSREDSESETESSSIFTPSRPLTCLSMKRRSTVQRRPSVSSSDGDSDNLENEPSVVKGDLREIKTMLKLLFNKVEKNERTLSELQNFRFSY